MKAESSKAVVMILSQRSFLFIFVNFVFVGCFGHSGSPYPSTWPKQIESSGCPNISGSYFLRNSGEANFFTKHFTNIVLSGFSTGMYYPKLERQKWVSQDEKNQYMKRAKVDDSLPNIKSLRIDQQTCSKLFITFFDDSGKIAVNQDGTQTLKCIQFAPDSYNSKFFRSKAFPASSGGGSSFAIGIQEHVRRIGADSNGNLVRNDVYRNCGLVLIPPIPICYSTSNTWSRYEKAEEINDLIFEPCQ